MAFTRACCLINILFVIDKSVPNKILEAHLVLQSNKKYVPIKILYEDSGDKKATFLCSGLVTESEGGCWRLTVKG